MPNTSSSAATFEDLLMRGTKRVLSEQDAVAWGRSLGALLPRGSAVALHGELGTGKTTLARAIAGGAGVEDVSVVTSPTFAILHEYSGKHGVIVHADLYRIKSSAELHTLGWDEVLSSAELVIVEWPERAGDNLPADTVHIELSHDTNSASRGVYVRP